ncbi:Hsp20 family protein [Reinekea thalattae]|uniref:Hsp20 family protein n=1 Tax=Reinekea thalattae TaxID=2593301 RepID=A0A5C8Z920_9GAMM|nr:Hsp20 family protein [Reinekea thalattae]TXR54187.1 Hsp20 family protein [Reinekea thalattae]
MRNAFDFSPLYRTTVGFDRIAQILDAAHQTQSSNTNYPPYDIEVTGENQYSITIAVAGFLESEIDIQSENGVLQVRGKKDKQPEKQNFLYQGIAYRSFERKFQLADYVEVLGARLEHGILQIDLVKEVPEAMKPKKIAINSTKAIEQSAE